MAAGNYAASERVAICDLLTALGPDQPTLCEGWTTRDLAAHLVTRERRPLAAPGLVVSPLSGYTDRVRRRMATRSFADLVAALRRPPRWSRPVSVDLAVNATEMYLHHEDARRGQPDWEPRELPADFAGLLWRRVRPPAQLRLRRFPGTVVVEAPGVGVVRTGAGGEEVRVTGPPGELALFLSGRQRAAQVAVTGPEPLADRLVTSRLNW